MEIKSREINHFVFGTKAETLERVRPLMQRGKVLDLFYFSFAEWSANRHKILDRIQRQFEGRVILRSSTKREDQEKNSLAGVHLSVLNVDPHVTSSVERGIIEIFGSSGSLPEDQILVQTMLDDVEVSGVIMTYDLQQGSPYYVINFDEETGRTDSVTGGTGIHKTVLIYRNAEETCIRSPRVSKFRSLAREVEEATGKNALDIEFAMDHGGELYLLQVRPITLNTSWHPAVEARTARSLTLIDEYVRDLSRRRQGIAGDRTVLSNMTDWNPAEIIGVVPRPLAASLYRDVITRDVWRTARAAMGYATLPPEELMILIEGHAFIDVRNSLNSFLPPGLSEKVREGLVDTWLARIEERQELHDKVEFEVVHTCYDFDFERSFLERYGRVFRQSDLDLYRSRLRELTNRCLDLSPVGSLKSAQSAVEKLAALQNARLTDRAVSASGNGALREAVLLLDQCRSLGTFQFAILARHAFIAERLLQTAVEKEALDLRQFERFKRSVNTVAGSLVSDFQKVCAGSLPRATFIERYGHLRPGTYEITSLRYDERDDLFQIQGRDLRKFSKAVFQLEAKQRHKINRLLVEMGSSGIDADTLFNYCRMAIASREYGKFVFTRNLSDVLNSIRIWGEHHGLSREDLSFLSWPMIADHLTSPPRRASDEYYMDIVDQGRRRWTEGQSIKLGFIIRNSCDVYVGTLQRGIANFVGSLRVTGVIFELRPDTPANVDLRSKIVCIESADPGFDWVFTKSIGGLVTKYGGPNSHMAIRCAELGIPAAIGCGELAYSRILSEGAVELDCKGQALRPFHAA